MRKIFVIALVLVFVGSSSAAIIFGTEESDSQRIIPIDPKLPAYDNPFESDLEDGNLHISFVGAFQYFDNGKPGETMDFYFTAVSKNDMQLTVDSGELFDNRSRRYNHDAWHDIGYDKTSRREIIAGVPVLIKFVYRVVRPKADDLPSVARVRFRFNDTWLEFRSIKVQDWDKCLKTLEELNF